jgi:FAD/FMN-containing dehydrogenase
MSTAPAPPLTAEALAAALGALLADPARVITAPAVVARLSRDFYWYSPVLKALLDDKVADLVVQPVSVEEVCAVLGFCHEHRVPVTARGAGTGNYGQAIPLERGVVLDLALMDSIEILPPPCAEQRALPCAGRVRASAPLRPKAARQAGSCAATRPRSPRLRSADSWAAARAASARSHTACCATSERSARSRS